MTTELEREIVDGAALERTVERLSASSIRLPNISQLADPTTIPDDVLGDLVDVDPDAPDPRNLFRVHWHNDASRRGFVSVPEHIELPSELTGVDARIIVVLGNRFPMIRAHKVLAAYGCLVPRLLTGRFDPTRHRAVWPSTGNYCRGGVAISRILGCRSIAVLPEGMSEERFCWLRDWVTNSGDIVRTFGTESNVKEIYDACHELAKDPANVILNQFSEFGNYVIHRAVTGPALEKVFRFVDADERLSLRAFVSASGSAGTLAAGDCLKSELGADVCVVEAMECPTLLKNGYGEHNIQGIGDKHVPLIHNVMNTDFVVGVSDAATDSLNLLFNSDEGRCYLSGRTGIGQETICGLAGLGLSSIANVIGAIKYAKYMSLGRSDVIITVATDGAELYVTELEKSRKRLFRTDFNELCAAEVFGRYLLGAAADQTLETTRIDRERMFNLGYFTWVEQQGIALEEFNARRDQDFWDSLMDLVPVWDGMIEAMNTRTSV